MLWECQSRPCCVVCCGSVSQGRVVLWECQSRPCCGSVSQGVLWECQSRPCCGSVSQGRVVLWECQSRPCCGSVSQGRVVLWECQSRPCCVVGVSVKAVLWECQSRPCCGSVSQGRVVGVSVKAVLGVLTTIVWTLLRKCSSHFRRAARQVLLKLFLALLLCRHCSERARRTHRAPPPPPLPPRTFHYGPKICLRVSQTQSHLLP